MIKDVETPYVAGYDRSVPYTVSKGNDMTTYFDALINSDHINEQEVSCEDKILSACTIRAMRQGAPLENDVNE